MFLVVFITLIISVIGLFAQVISLQNARIYNAQNALMQTMSVWHSTAAGMTYTIASPTNMGTATGSGTTSGCRMTTGSLNTTDSAIPACAYGGGGLTVTSTNLPAGYNMATYSFMTLAFKTTPATGTANDYIVTYTHDTDASGSILLPDSGGTSVGFSMRDLVLQFNRNQNNLAYGNVLTSGLLTVQSNGPSAVATTLPYYIPTSIPVGSIALISAAR